MQMVYIQVTNKHGSTKDPPVMVEALVASDIPIQPERLRQLAQIITGSPPMDNLGLDHSVFGKVKEICLSSYLNHTLYAPAPTPTPTPAPAPAPAPTPTPTPSPSPSPEMAYHTGPSVVPSYSPALSPNSHNALPPCPTAYAYKPLHSLHEAPYHILSPNSGSAIAAQGCQKCAPHPSPTSLPDQISPNMDSHFTRKSLVAVSRPQTSPANSLENRSGKVLVSPLQVSSSHAYSCKYHGKISIIL